MIKLLFKPYILLLTIAMIAVVGCRQQDDDPTTVVRMGAGDFNITLSTAPYQPATKGALAPAANPLENAIFNLHVFLIPLHTSAGTGAQSFPEDARHYYFDNFSDPYNLGTIKLDRVYFGKYKIYILANNGPKLFKISGTNITPWCDMSGKSGLHEGCEVDSIENTEQIATDLRNAPWVINAKGVLMTHSSEVILGSNPSDVFEFEMTRIMAKVDMGQIIVSNSQQLILKPNATIVNMVQRTKPFITNYIPEATIPALFSNITLSNYGATPFPLYLFANPRNESVPAHSDEKDRNQKNAPERATHIFMGGNITNITNDFNFAIYIGDTEASLDNYKIENNRQYALNLTFGDMTNIDDDPRISQVTVNPVSPHDFNSNSSFNQNTTYTISFEVTYKHIFNENLRLLITPAITDEYSTGVKASMVFTLKIDDKGTITTYNSDIKDQTITHKITQGSGTIKYDITYKHTTSGNGTAIGGFTFDFSSSRGSILTSSASNITFY